MIEGENEDRLCIFTGFRSQRRSILESIPALVPLASPRRFSRLRTSSRALEVTGMPRCLKFLGEDALVQLTI